MLRETPDRKKPQSIAVLQTSEMVGGISNCSNNNSNPDNNNDDNNNSSSAPSSSDWSTFFSSPVVECSFAVLTSAPCAIALMLFWRLMYRWVSPQLTKVSRET